MHIGVQTLQESLGRLRSKLVSQQVPIRMVACLVQLKSRFERKHVQGVLLWLKMGALIVRKFYVRGCEQELTDISPFPGQIKYPIRLQKSFEKAFKRR